MDPLKEDLSNNEIFILQSDGKKTGSPVRFGFYALAFCLYAHTKRYINQYQFDVRNNSIQLIPPGSILSFEDKSEKLEYIILFNETFLKSSIDTNHEINLLLEFHQNNIDQIILPDAVVPEFKLIFNKIDSELKKQKSEYLSVVKLHLLEILYKMKREKVLMKTRRPVIRTQAEQITNDYLQLIEKHFITKKNVKDYAQLLNITAKHLSTTIKAQTNKNALTFIHTRIYNEMLYLLVYSQLSIKQIANLLHFETPTACSRFFKKYSNISPQQYRLKNKN
jgi:AraC family transcriptional activator of pobA